MMPYWSESIDPEQGVVPGIEGDDEQGVARNASVEQRIDDLLLMGERQNRSALLVTTLAQLIAERLVCREVLDSELYQEPHDTEIANRYRQSIGDFCS